MDGQPDHDGALAPAPARPDPAPWVDPWHHGPERGTARAWARSHPGGVAASVLVAVLLMAGVSALLSALGHRGDDHGVPPNQAGYLWCCGAHDVSAQWTVPRLAHATRVGAEAV